MVCFMLQQHVHVMYIINSLFAAINRIMAIILPVRQVHHMYQYIRKHGLVIKIAEFNSLILFYPPVIPKLISVSEYLRSFPLLF